MKVNKANSLIMVYYNTTAPSMHVLNRPATSSIIEKAGAANRAARVYNTILNSRGTAIGRAVSIQNSLGESIRRYCLSCPIGGYYARVRDVEQIQNLYDDALMNLDDVKLDIIAEYPKAIAKVKQDLGDFVNEVTLPTATEVASKFTISLRLLNQPTPITGVLKGLSDEVSYRVEAESRMASDELLRAAHAGPLADLRNTLNDIADKLRNAKRLHLTQFDALTHAVNRVADLNVLDLPEVDDVVTAAHDIIKMRQENMTHSERIEAAINAESVVTIANQTIAALGL
jgi:hypothetical protein